MKLIIADDEPHICSLLKHLIKWEELGLECAGVYNSGDQVIRHFENDTADIVICDIEMPVVNGLNVIKEVMAVYPGCKFIILSGFRNFDYAQTAIKYGVKDYLLKPVNEQELNKVLSDIIHDKNNSIIIESALSRYKQRKKFADSVLSGRDYRGKSLQELNQQFNMSMREGYFNAVYVSFAAANVDADYVDHLAGWLEDALIPRLKDFCYDCEAIRESALSQYIFFNYTADNNERMSLVLDKLYHDAIAEFSGKTQCGCFLGIGTPVDKVDEVGKSLLSAKIANCRRFILPGRRIHYSEERVYDGRDENKAVLNPNEASALRAIVEQIDASKLEGWWEQCGGNRERLFRESPYLISLYVGSVAEAFLAALADCAQVDDPDRIKGSFYDAFNSSETMGDVGARVLHIMAQEISRRLADRKLNAEIYVQKAKNYINKNYKQPITLDKLAEELHISPTYLSALFKGQIGMNYVDYLAQVRIDAAKKMLRASDCNLTQISEGVGYANQAYFSKLFLKLTGLKPSEYRRLHHSDTGE